MATYDPITGHKTSPHQNAHDDIGGLHEYTVNCDWRVAYRVRAVDAWTAERKARKLYYDDAGEFPANVSARW